MTEPDRLRQIGAIWNIESPRIIARLMRFVRDIGVAEDLAQDALVVALERWPESGIPDKPGAWLMSTAKRKAIDWLRRNKLRDRKYEEAGRMTDPWHELQSDAALDDAVGDELLRLIFMTCHPVLSVEARAALTLRLLCGLTTDEIASAYLAAEPTVAQRIVRAKRTLAAAGVPFEVPGKAELPARLSSVLEFIYLMFNEGYAATAGEQWIRPALCREALRLVRILAELAPDEPEVHGLAALMEIQSSRFKARVGPTGEPILLANQNRALWDRLLIRRGLDALEKVRRLGRPFGPYALQAAIAACHAEANAAEETNWTRIAALYEALARAMPSPVVELNRAVAVAMAFGPSFGLRIVDELRNEPAMKQYHLLPSVRGDLLAKLGRTDEARKEFERGAELARNSRERELLLKRASDCAGDSFASPIGTESKKGI